MFKTIRAKLIGLSMLALVLIFLVGMAADYLGREAANQSSQSNHSEMVAPIQESAMHELVRADVLQVMQAGKIGEAAAYEAAVQVLNKHLKTLTDKLAQNKTTATLTGKTRQAMVTSRADAGNFVKLAQDIGALPLVAVATADAQWLAFNDAYKTLTIDQAVVNNLMPAEIEAMHKAERAVAQQSSYLALVVMAAALIIFSVVAYLVYRGITQPLNQLSLVSNEVEAGAYDVRMNLRTKNELGSVARTLDKLLDDRSEAVGVAAKENERLNNSVIGLFVAMGALSEKDLTVRAPVTEDIIGTLGDAINQLTDVTATVLHHVTKIAGVVEHASERMKQQSDVVNVMAKEEDVIVARLTANLETAMTSIGEVAVLANDSNQAATEATKSTESAMHTVQATLSGMNVIRETISEMEKRIKRLGERSQEISQIVNLINTISERTHVLSLNAAMQAAMAGDAGRGFAVVAEEVQRLAENSRQATGQIANLVQNIQVETNDTIATVNKTIDQVVKESELAHNAGERMRETHQATARLVELVATIAHSSAEQTKIAVSLRSAADEITQFTAKTGEQLAAQNQSAASLVTASKKLMESVSVFKLPPVNT
jgi:methyl-accepting chemotaxis protein